ncbi:MAG: sulfite oxidase heme-binding subunit YedZ [Steroidobacteraceae bacterium]
MPSVAQRYRYIYKPAVFTASLAPAVLLALGAFNLLGQSLGPDPVSRLLHACGHTALNFILITLLVTPVREMSGLTNLARLRRMLGLFTLFYASLHFLVYLLLDQELDLKAVLADITKRPYITLGFAALLMLIPLGVTSTARMMRRLGRRWQRLHQLIYPAAILGVWHYYWQVKRDVREPLLYASLLALLLGYRIVTRWQRSRQASRRLTSTSGSATAPERT